MAAPTDANREIKRLLVLLHARLTDAARTGLGRAAGVGCGRISWERNRIRVRRVPFAGLGVEIHGLEVGRAHVLHVGSICQDRKSQSGGDAQLAGLRVRDRGSDGMRRHYSSSTAAPSVEHGSYRRCACITT